MSAYLQRLLDTAAPRSEPLALTPVVKSTSPIFEQNQLPGLASLYAEEGEADAAPQVLDAPGAAAVRAPTPLPPATASAIAQPKGTRRDPVPVSPTPSLHPAVGRSAAESPLPTIRSAVDAAPPPPERSRDAAVEPAPSDPETVEPQRRLETMLHAAPEVGLDALAPLEALAPVFAPPQSVSAPAASEGVASETARPIEPRVILRPEEREQSARAVSLDEPRAPAPIEPLGSAPPRPVALEPRARPAFDGAEHDSDEPRPEPQQAPRITIGRLTVALEPDAGPAARPVRPARTAATASVIGPLGNRRARRRLFALARL
jgi:hypothetical protein